MTWLLRILLFAAAPVLIVPASASNVTDHWWSATESGWGMSISQQDNVAFIAIFAYARDGTPVWLSGAATRYGADTSGNPGFAGALYRTTGPWLGGAFDPTAVQAVQVGTVTFESTSRNTAVLVYTVDGVQVAKNVERFTFRHKDWSGIYRGVQRANYIDCAAGFKPAFIYDDGLIDVEHDGESFRMWFDGGKAACMYTGAYSQHGRVGTVSGTYVCADGPSGSFTLTDLESHDRSFAARIKATHPSCGLMLQDMSGFSLQSSPP